MQYHRHHHDIVTEVRLSSGPRSLSLAKHVHVRSDALIIYVIVVVWAGEALAG